MAEAPQSFTEFDPCLGFDRADARREPLVQCALVELVAVDHAMPRSALRLGELLDLAHQSDEVCEVVPESRALSLGGRGDLSEVVSQLTDR